MTRPAVATLMHYALTGEGNRPDIITACAGVRVAIKRYYRKIGKPLGIHHPLYACDDPHKLLEEYAKLPPEAQTIVKWESISI